MSNLAAICICCGQQWRSIDHGSFFLGNSVVPFTKPVICLTCVNDKKPLAPDAATLWIESQ